MVTDTVNGFNKQDIFLVMVGFFFVSRMHLLMNEIFFMWCVSRCPWSCSFNIRQGWNWGCFRGGGPFVNTGHHIIPNNFYKNEIFLNFNFLPFVTRRAFCSRLTSEIWNKSTFSLKQNHLILLRTINSHWNLKLQRRKSLL